MVDLVTRRHPWGGGIVKVASGDRYAAKAQPDVELVEGESAMQAAQKAGLDWSVAMRPVQIAGGKRAERYQAVVREDTGEALSIVGNRYQTIQPKELYEFTDAIVDTSASDLVAAGELDGGRRIFSVVRLPETIRPDHTKNGDETLDVFLFVANRFDGKSSFRASIFPVREVCTNTMRVVAKGLVSTFAIRHVTGMKARIAEAQTALGLASTYIDAFQAEIDEFLGQSFTDAEFEKLTHDLFPAPTDPEKQKTLETVRENRRNGLLDTWVDSPNLANIRGTGWGAVNAVAEWEQWINPAPKKFGGDGASYQLDLATRRVQPASVFDRAVRLVRAAR